MALPPIPAPITPVQIDAWREALGISKADASAMVGKAANFWSQFLAETKGLKLSELNTLLSNFGVRQRAKEIANHPPKA